MKKHRVSTTISQKHWELLKKYADKFETHQRVIELALESLERIESMKNNSKSDPPLTSEEECWRRTYYTKSMCIIPKEVLPNLFSTANNEINIEYMTKSNTFAYAIEYYMMKPLKECSLKEIVDVLTIILRTGNFFDSVDCIENGSCYKLIITHTLGLNSSKILSLAYEKIFESIGIKAESVISERSIFMKIFINE